MYLLKNGYILENNKLIKKDLYIIDNKISYSNINNLNNYIEIDCSNLLVMPGACDLHVHLREPGFTEKETIKSGTLSAAKGGITTLCAMPNIIPYPDCYDNLKIELDIIKKDALVNVIPYGCITKGEKSIELAKYNELKECIAFSDDGVGIDDLNLLEKAANAIKKENKFIVSHAEVGDKKYTPEGEYEAVKRELDIVRKTNIKYHFCHISTKESIEYIKKAKEEGLNVTFEITPHHLLLNENDINNNTNFKMNPPLSTVSNMKACNDALINGLCDAISTDHAPHTYLDKNKEYSKALNGIIGLETMLPLIYTYYVKTNKISLKRFYDLVINNPRKILGLDSRYLNEGEIADITILDINNYYIYKEEEILSKSKNTPFLGYNLTGFSKYTFVNGNLIYERK